MELYKAAHLCFSWGNHTQTDDPMYSFVDNPVCMHRVCILYHFPLPLDYTCLYHMST